MNEEEFDDVTFEKDEGDSTFSILSVYKACFSSDLFKLIPIAISVALWLFTAWIPFVGIGTTIALFTLPVDLVGGKKISPIDIFCSSHRRNLFSFFILLGLMGVGCSAAAFPFTFLGTQFVGPAMGFWAKTALYLFLASAATAAVTLSTGWSMAPFLLLEKGLEPLEALQESLKLTAGNRLKIFGIYAAPVLASFILMYFLASIPYLGWLFAVSIFIASATVCISLTGKIYGTLKTPEEPKS